MMKRNLKHMCSIPKILLWKALYRNRISANIRSIIGKHVSLEIESNAMCKLSRIHVEAYGTIAVRRGAKLFMGNSVYINKNCTITCHQKIEIGAHCSFGPNLCIFDHDHRFSENGQIRGQYRCGDVQIGDNCWFGGNVIILRGTVVGDNCVIGAGTVLSGVIPPNSLVVQGRQLLIKPLSASPGRGLQKEQMEGNWKDIGVC